MDDWREIRIPPRDSDLFFFVDMECIKSKYADNFWRSSLRIINEKNNNKTANIGNHLVYYIIRSAYVLLRRGGQMYG